MNLAECYTALGLKPGASSDEIHQAYKRLAMKYHPDRSPEADRSHARFCRTTAAYTTLKRIITVEGDVENLGVCGQCGEIRPLYSGLVSERRCAECLLALRNLRLPMTLRTVRCLIVIVMQLLAAYCLVAAVTEDSLGAAFLGVALLLGAMAALSYHVLTSIIVRE